MTWRTSSNLERVETCPASVVIPGFPHAGVESAHGVKNHDRAEHGDLPPRLLALTLECLAGTTRREVSIVLDVKTRAVARMADGARNYGELGEWEIGTTPDFYGQLPQPRTWRVRDWKSRKLVTTPSQNPQIISQALAIFASKGAAIVDAGLGYLANDAEDAHTFTIFDVPGMWTRLERIVERGHNAKPDQISESQQCEYCRCLTTCPAKRAAIVQLGVDAPASLDHMPAVLVGEVRNRAKSLRKFLDRIDELVEMRARREDVPVGGGKVLRLVDSSRRSLDQDKARNFIVQHGEDLREFEKVSTFTQVRECKAK